MTYIFGDIHGCLKSFNTLLDQLRPGKSDTVITLGDYVDRGPSSKGVVDRLLALQSETNLIALRGNHEIMMEDARQGPPASSFWLLNGGIETLESYQTRSLNDVPEAHWEFFRKLKSYHQTDDYLLVHATPPSDGQLEDYDQDDLYWARFRDPEPRKDGLFLICGHTPQEDFKPFLQNAHLCLDTGCVHEGYLTALTLETGDYIQAKEDGQTMKGKVELQAPEAAV